MNNRFEALNSDDVVSVNPETFENLDISHTSRVVHLLAALQEYFYHATNEAILFTEGIDCEVLRLGAKGWQKGKVRINLEFCPNQLSEPESPLDDIRQTLKQAEIS
ncbi:MAG TPA: KGK domain-containing protein [Cyanobacteria bacterium UBA11049]|nr:KGK domain-containing protein [Cyanobacteria bacterium UBA11049]